VLIKRHREEAKYGSIVIPEKYLEFKHHGKVIAVGERVEGVKPGDFVVWGKYSGAELDNKRYLIITIDEIQMVVEVEEESVNEGNVGEANCDAGVSDA